MIDMLLLLQISHITFVQNQCVCAVFVKGF